MRTTVLSPATDYLFLSATGSASVLPGGDAFWAQPPEQLDRLGRGWLVAEFEFSADWPSWEMHPAGDELVYLLSGAASLLLERPEGLEALELKAPALVVVPRGVWHTAKVSQPSRFLHVTLGEGTETRPV